MIEYIDCLSIANKIKDGIREKLNGASPLLCVEGFDGNPDDAMYLRGVEKDAAELGIRFNREFHGNSDGILLFNGIELSPGLAHLDVDGITDASPHIRAVTEAVFRAVTSQTFLRGKMVTIIGRGSVGASIADKLLAEDATVAICHSKTDRAVLSNLFSTSNIVVCAARNAVFTLSMLQNNAIVIDVSNSFVTNDFDEMMMRKVYMTPKKNGVGLITRAILLERVADNYLQREARKL